jgi:signal transduction histidine kinase
MEAGAHPSRALSVSVVAPWLVLGVGFAVVSLSLPRGHAQMTFGDIFLCVLPLLANAALLANAGTPYRRTNSFWILMAAGCGLWLVGSLIWTYCELVLHRPSGFTYVGNIAYFLHPVPFMAALALQPHARGLRDALRYGIIDFSLLVTAWIYIYAFSTLPWIYVAPNPQLYLIRGWQAYIGENLVYICGLAFLLFQTRTAWRKIYGHLLGIAVVHMAGFLIIAWASLAGLYSSGSIYDLAYAITFLWLGMLGVMARRLTLAPDQNPVGQQFGRYWPQWLAIAGVLFIPFLAGWSIFLSRAPSGVREFRLMLTLVALMVGMGLVFFRQQLINQERQRLVKTLQNSIDNLKRLQSQFVQSEKLASLGQLAAGAAHEINNPLTAILGYSDLLVDEESAGPRARSLAEKIREQARRTRELVTNLLSFARQVPAEKQILDLAATLNGAIQLRTLDLRNKNIRIEVQNRGILPAVRGDPNQLLQVFFQIISNAVDAMEASGGVLTVRTERERANVVIEFSDSGPGLAEPERVFDPFYTTKPVGKGSGLGLSICYGIIQEHGGSISGFNRVDGGATFRIELPAVLALLPQLTPAVSPVARAR